MIKAAVAKAIDVKNEILPPSSQLIVNESRAKGLNRDIDNLLDDQVIQNETFKPIEGNKRYTMVR